MQGDVTAGNTIMALTRNIWSASRDERRSYIENNGGRKDSEVWKYPAGDRPWLAYVQYHVNLRSMGGDQRFLEEKVFYGPGSDALSMAGFHKDEANWVTSANSVEQGSSFDFIAQLNISKDTFDEGAAIPLTGLNLTVLRPAQDGPNPVGAGEFVR